MASRADSTVANKPAVDAALVPSTPPEPETPAPGPTHRVRFKSGESFAVVEGGVVRGERARYLLAASKGQKMRVSIKSMENNAVFSIVDATGKVVPGTEEGNDTMTWEGLLPASGDTLIVVGGTRGNASFTLRVEITSPGK